MKHEETYTSSMHTHVHFMVYEPEIVLRIKAIVMILHDAGENLEMYDHFANFLQNKGFVVVVSDIAGHGRSLVDYEQGYFGVVDVLQALMTDINHLQQKLLERYADVPYYMLGAGLGGQLIKYYGSQYGDFFAGMLLLSTSSQTARMALSENRLQMYKVMRGATYHPSAYIRQVREKLSEKLGGHRFDWLVHSLKRQEDIEEDTLSHFTYTAQGYLDLLKIYRKVNERAVYKQTPNYLSIGLFGGKEDPLTREGRDLEHIAKRYREYGFSDVTIKIYEHSRHAILFDDEKQQVYDDIHNWLNQRTYLI